ncbi:MAG TPA: flagellar basal body P-ring formation chaperone FlgA [Ferrovibrio sp.]|jgi:flagella basal body P-ring formation protein FlgA|uniref:flagellar basal body P-ring formation chaperone FlgA n=1 Tax=Ferrovibrio sp. TaxID=1917215 RepID=UPI002B4B4E10|nr:flagellar basal body P-ring formation chaperone FlgA [Ferrovibrio sp.]HLT76196.1 flagellar basal body P-ring formation chaperone FlgA [Ferrovibrio sp.]
MVSFRILLLAGLAVATIQPDGVVSAAMAQERVAALSSGRVITEREVAKRMAELVQQRNGGQPVEINFHGIGNDLEVPGNGPATLQVESFTYDRRSGRFYAAVTAPGRTEAMKVSGRAQPVESIPVLKNRVAAGEVITRADIEWIQVPAGRYGSGYVDQLSDLVGQTPRRPLLAGSPIRVGDVGRPEAVSKNALVTMIAQGPGMTITTTGRSLEGGSIGDVVQVMNLQSKKTIQATIIGSNQVQVNTAPRVIASN